MCGVQSARVGKLWPRVVGWVRKQVERPMRMRARGIRTTVEGVGERQATSHDAKG